MKYRAFRDPKEQARRKYRYFLRLRYGIEEHEFDEMVQQQLGKCAIPSCENVAEWIDHDHGTGKVRGMVCASCNMLFGLANDDPQILREAAEYIEAHRQISFTRKPYQPPPRLKASPEEREFRRQLMLGNTHPKGHTPWNKGKKMSPEHMANLAKSQRKWWASLSEERQEAMRDHGRRGAQKRWDSLSKEQRENYQTKRRESLNEEQREALRLGRQKRWEKK